MSEEDQNPLEQHIDQALADYMQQSDQGQLTDREEFLSRYPELREHLSELLSAADWIEQLAGPTIADLAHGEPNDAPHSREHTEETLPHYASIKKATSADTVAGSGQLSPPSKLWQPVLPCQFGDYVLERVIGRGGMGVVYAGRQANLDRMVAIKMIRSGALASEEEVHRFYAEARSAAKLAHPNIVTVYQCGEVDGHRFFSMDLVDGTDLSRMTKDGPLDAKLAATYVRDVARAIQYAHEHGVLHRDLKPANILVDRKGLVRITDFGLAKVLGKESGLTATGAALGTPSYMSPEQAAGKVAEQGQATDTYSLGAILFALVTGKPPFKADTVVETIMHVIHRPAPTARSLNGDLDADIETIIDRCLQKKPEQRYDSAGQLADDLDRYLTGTPIQARPMSKVRRAWYWVLGVPIVGAVLDHRVVEPTEAHRWVQRGLISVALLMLAAWLAMLVAENTDHNRMPTRVPVAAGLPGGAYHRVATALTELLTSQKQCQAEVVTSLGSNQNVELLESRAAQLALVQADAIRSSNVAVLAPLYYEAVHILVRKPSSIHDLSELRNRRVNVGPEKSGSREVASMLLASSGLSFDDIQALATDWHQLGSDPDIDAAIVVSQVGSSDVNAFLAQHPFELLALPIPAAVEFALGEPSFRPLMLTAEDYPGTDLPADGLATVGTVAFLAARQDTPPVLVDSVLKVLFQPEFVNEYGIVTAEHAAHWQNLPWHPTALEFFQDYRSARPLR